MSPRTKTGFARRLHGLGYGADLDPRDFTGEPADKARVLDILIWLWHRVDVRGDGQEPNAILEEGSRATRDIHQTLQRIQHGIHVNTRLQLNVRRLAEAGEFAVREMARVVTYIEEAMESARVFLASCPGKGSDETAGRLSGDSAGEDPELVDTGEGGDGTLKAVLEDVSRCGEEVLQCGARLSSSLEHEAELTRMRHKALGLDSAGLGSGRPVTLENVQALIADEMAELKKERKEQREEAGQRSEELAGLNRQLRQLRDEQEGVDHRRAEMEQSRTCLESETKDLHRELDSLHEKFVSQVLHVQHLGDRLREKVAPASQAGPVVGPQEIAANLPTDVVNK